MIEILKNMFRRKLRTTLTVFGIAIGIFALVVMGAMAEKIQLLVDGGVKYYKDKVMVGAQGNIFGSAPLLIEKQSEIGKIEGVAAVSASVGTTLKKEMDTVNFGPPASITAGDFKDEGYEKFEIYMSKGRKLTKEDVGKAVVGSDLVKKLNAEVGKEITVRDRKFEVVGIIEKTLTAPDNTVRIPFSDAQEIVYEGLPEISKKQVKADQIVSDFIVFPKEGIDTEDLAKRINEKVTGVKATSAKTFIEQIANSLAVFNQIIYGIALISLLVGTLSIINTMTMSISERTKEIGVKKALGAKSRDILTEYLTEAGLIGFLGGAIGIGIGTLMVNGVNTIMERTGDKLFLLTPRLMWGSLIFSVVLGVLAGIYPAVHAVRINIVKAVREE